jgi:diguanylate cyclase (GGDEF)-like protein
MTATALIISTRNPPGSALKKKILKTDVFTQVVVCHCGEAAIAELQKQKIDMIFWVFGAFDDPTEWLETLHLNPAWIDLPVLIFTKEGAREQRMRGLELGACDSVTFVTPAAELAVLIRGHLKRSKQINQLRNRRAELAQMALKDPLTGLCNRASFDLRLGQEVARSRRSGTSLALMLIDLDGFKWFNDCYGHQAGDAILKAVSGAFSDAVRDPGVVCRYGGERFAIILPGTALTSAKHLAEQLQHKLSILSRDLWQNESALTASIGLTCFAGSRVMGVGELIGEADTALCQAKNSGRNRTEIFLPTTPQLPMVFDYTLPEKISLKTF